MKKCILMLLIAAGIAVSGCTFVKENIGSLAGGTVAVAQAPAAQSAIAACVEGDDTAIAALQAPNAFFTTGYEVLTEKGADVPILDLVNASPEYFDDIPSQWAAIWTALDGKDCGPVVAQFKANGEAAWEGIQNAIKTSDRLKTACAFWATASPLAAMFSPIPLPSKIPGCSA